VLAFLGLCGAVTFGSVACKTRRFNSSVASETGVHNLSPTAKAIHAQWEVHYKKLLKEYAGTGFDDILREIFGRATQVLVNPRSLSQGDLKGLVYVINSFPGTGKTRFVTKIAKMFNLNSDKGDFITHTAPAGSGYLRFDFLEKLGYLDIEDTFQDPYLTPRVLLLDEYAQVTTEDYLENTKKEFVPDLRDYTGESEAAQKAREEALQSRRELSRLNHEKWMDYHSDKFWNSAGSGKFQKAEGAMTVGYLNRVISHASELAQIAGQRQVIDAYAEIIQEKLLKLGKSVNEITADAADLGNPNSQPVNPAASEEEAVAAANATINKANSGVRSFFGPTDALAANLQQAYNDARTQHASLDAPYSALVEKAKKDISSLVVFSQPLADRILADKEWRESTLAEYFSPASAGGVDQAEARKLVFKNVYEMDNRLQQQGLARHLTELFLSSPERFLVRATEVRRQLDEGKKVNVLTGNVFTFLAGNVPEFENLVNASMTGAGSDPRHRCTGENYKRFLSVPIEVAKAIPIFKQPDCRRAVTMQILETEAGQAAIEETLKRALGSSNFNAAASRIKAVFTPTGDEDVDKKLRAAGVLGDAAGQNRDPQKKHIGFLPPPPTRAFLDAVNRTVEELRPNIGKELEKLGVSVPSEFIVDKSVSEATLSKALDAASGFRSLSGEVESMLYNFLAFNVKTNLRYRLNTHTDDSARPGVAKSHIPKKIVIRYETTDLPDPNRKGKYYRQGFLVAEEADGRSRLRSKDYFFERMMDRDNIPVAQKQQLTARYVKDNWSAQLRQQYSAFHAGDTALVARILGSSPEGEHVNLFRREPDPTDPFILGWNNVDRESVDVFPEIRRKIMALLAGVASETLATGGAYPDSPMAETRIHQARMLIDTLFIAMANKARGHHGQSIKWMMSRTRDGKRFLNVAPFNVYIKADSDPLRLPELLFREAAANSQPDPDRIKKGQELLNEAYRLLFADTLALARREEPMLRAFQLRFDDMVLADETPEITLQEFNSILINEGKAPFEILDGITRAPQGRIFVSVSRAHDEAVINGYNPRRWNILHRYFDNLARKMIFQNSKWTRPPLGKHFRQFLERSKYRRIPKDSIDPSATY
jgi:hypothetical protein